MPKGTDRPSGRRSATLRRLGAPIAAVALALVGTVLVDRPGPVHLRLGTELWPGPVTSTLFDLERLAGLRADEPRPAEALVDVAFHRGYARARSVRVFAEAQADCCFPVGQGCVVFRGSTVEVWPAQGDRPERVVDTAVGINPSPALHLSGLAWRPDRKAMAVVLHLGAIGPHALPARSWVRMVGLDGRVEDLCDLADTYARPLSVSPTGRWTVLLLARGHKERAHVVLVGPGGKLASVPHMQHVPASPFLWHPSGETACALLSTPRPSGPPAYELWECDMAAGKGRLLSSGPLHPLAYDGAGEHVLALRLRPDGTVSGLVRVSASTGAQEAVPTTGAVFPREGTPAQTSVTPDGKTAAIVLSADRPSLCLLDLETYALRVYGAMQTLGLRRDQSWVPLVLDAQAIVDTR